LKQQTTATIYYTKLEYNRAVNAAQDTKLRQKATDIPVHHKYNYRRTLHIKGGVNIMQFW